VSTVTTPPGTIVARKAIFEPIRHSVVHHNGRLAIRQGDWKLISDLQGNGSRRGRRELYNLKMDPDEKNNLLDERPEIVERLTEMLLKQMKQGYSRRLG